MWIGVGLQCLVQPGGRGVEIQIGIVKDNSHDIVDILQPFLCLLLGDLKLPGGLGDLVLLFVGPGADRVPRLE